MKLFFLALLAACLLCGCTEGEKETLMPSPEAESMEDIVWEEYGGETAAGEDEAVSDPIEPGLRIALVTSPYGQEDPYNSDCYKGIRRFADSVPGTEVLEFGGNDLISVLAHTESILRYCDIVVTPGRAFSGISALALRYPDKLFLLADAGPGDAEEAPLNVHSLTYAQEEMGFLAGVCAALETAAGKVAILCGGPESRGLDYRYGFEAGVAYAGNKYGAAAELVTLEPEWNTFAGSAWAEGQAKAAAGELIAAGADVLFASEDCAAGVLAAAEENPGVLAIGCGVNPAGIDTPISFYKTIGGDVEQVLSHIQSGILKGRNTELDISSGSIGYIVNHEASRTVQPETLARLEEVYGLVRDGLAGPAARTRRDYTNH